LNSLSTEVNIMSSEAEKFKQYKIQTSSNSDDEYIKGFKSGAICAGKKTLVNKLDIKRKETKLQYLTNLRDVYLKNEETKEADTALGFKLRTRMGDIMIFLQSKIYTLQPDQQEATQLKLEAEMQMLDQELKQLNSRSQPRSHLTLDRINKKNS